MASDELVQKAAATTEGASNEPEARDEAETARAMGCAAEVKARRTTSTAGATRAEGSHWRPEKDVVEWLAVAWGARRPTPAAVAVDEAAAAAAADDDEGVPSKPSGKLSIDGSPSSDVSRAKPTADWPATPVMPPAKNTWSVLAAGADTAATSPKTAAAWSVAHPPAVRSYSANPPTETSAAELLAASSVAKSPPTTSDSPSADNASDVTSPSTPPASADHDELAESYFARRASVVAPSTVAENDPPR